MLYKLFRNPLTYTDKFKESFSFFKNTDSAEIFKEQKYLNLSKSDETSLTKAKNGVESGWTHSDLAHHFLARLRLQRGSRPRKVIPVKVSNAPDNRSRLQTT